MPRCARRSEKIGLAQVGWFHLERFPHPAGQPGGPARAHRAGARGSAPFRFFLTDPVFRGIPMVLETPKENEADRRNLALFAPPVEDAVNDGIALIAFDVDGTLVDHPQGKVIWELLNARFVGDDSLNHARYHDYKAGRIDYPTWVALDVEGWIAVGATRSRSWARCAVCVRSMMRPRLSTNCTGGAISWP